MVVSNLLLNKLVEPVDMNQESHGPHLPAESRLDIEDELGKDSDRVENTGKEKGCCKDDI
jgi:hypothetical protein